MEINYELGNFLFEKKMGDFGAQGKPPALPWCFCLIKQAISFKVVHLC